MSGHAEKSAAPVPMRAQATASNPAYSVWVSANAGTGKTKVLTDRVLRLLLQGVSPARILCITYTKAAAAEMQNRMHRTLSRWVGMEEPQLAAELQALTERRPRPAECQYARSLFATVLDAPEGVRIQTIHSFCQSLLRRFPLEAGVQPHFEVIDDRTAMELVAEAKQRLFSRSLGGAEPWLRDAVDVLAGRLAEGSFQELLRELIKQRRHFSPALARPSGAIRLISDAYSVVEIPYGMTQEQLFADIFHYSPAQENALRKAINLLEEGAKTDISASQDMALWWREEPQHRVKHWQKYQAVWLTQKGEMKENPFTKSIRKKYPELESIMRDEQERVLRSLRRLQALHVAQMTEASVNVIDAILSIYSHLKEIHQFLDYEDLVRIALRLLRRPGVAPWVLFKLDGGVEHVLIDEAQDTSPEQWALVELLVSEFFDGEARRPQGMPPRTLFVVGDEKQSIYSFQGAAPRAFRDKQQYFARKAQEAQLQFRTVTLGTSFRSTDAVLRVVDAVINQPHVQAGLRFMEEDAPHIAHREGQAGLVELWPVVQLDKVEKPDVWQVNESTDIQENSRGALAERIASTLRRWLRDGERLQSQNRPLRAGDVLILVRSRNAFLQHLVRALKRHDVPVAGVDRMMLTQNIAVMDMLALAEFLLLPEDDLSLACLLKSPLCGVTEEQLFTLAYGRGHHSLWKRVQADGQMQEVAEFLSGLLEQVDYIRPYELFARVLEELGGRGRFAARLGQEVFDPLDEFLALALEYERNHAPSLQGFLHWMRSGDSEIKRDMEQGQDAVRIMTVHGAKGLQAPVVFLPDTVEAAGAAKGRLSPPLWGEKDGEPLVLWSPSQAEDDPMMAEWRDAGKRAEAEEHRRLLYVAMTRAEDRLYICGAMPSNRKQLPEDCWYSWIRSGMEGIATRHSHVFCTKEGEATEEILRVENAQTAPLPAAADATAIQDAPPLPPALRAPPPPEPYPPQPLVPSRHDGDVVIPAADAAGDVLSPVQEGERFQRGNLIHRLLQWLPDTPPAQRRVAGMAYLARYAAQTPPSAREEMLAEVLAVLDDAAMSPVFAAGSLAEVPVSGLVALREGAVPRILSGQIDRLRVTEDGVWIVDYKTQRVPPARLEDVPPAYLRQMAVYRAALQRIYPDRPVHCALLWTAAPLLMPLPADLLASLLDSPQN